MPDSKRRHYLESLLKTHLHAAEKQLAANPQMKEMLGKVRQLYLSDKTNFLQAVSPPANPPQAKNALPLSRIPELILVLDQLGKKSANRFPAGPLFRSSVPSQPSAQIARLETEIEKAETLWAMVKREEPAIRARSGRYATVATRLQFERLLRELPGRIASLRKAKEKLLEEQAQGGLR
ncbi:MAG: hypothetical protein RBU29_02135 [bacterium]|jgi:hypothetical protein|nr:hypothetical protein [bacterium]